MADEDGYERSDSFVTKETDVYFAHARAYEDGYVFEIHDLQVHEASQFAISWSALPKDVNWTPHDLVEYVFDRLLPRIAAIIGDRDLVVYYDCLRSDCDAPHVVTRRVLEANGVL